VSANADRRSDAALLSPDPHRTTTLTSVHLHQRAISIAPKVNTAADIVRLSFPPLFKLRERIGRPTLPPMGRDAMPSKAPKIVVVEDDASMGRAIERILLAGNFTPAVFVSAEAALEDGAAQMADGLVLDIHLPGMSGFDLYRELALSGKTIPVVFITARDEPATRDEAARLGGTRSYLAKPFSGRRLLEAITLSLDGH
jgi:CheY-like chemotaxis protein